MINHDFTASIELVKKSKREKSMLNHGPALLPFPGFFFEGSAIFTSAAENIGNLWNEACKHGLKAGRHTYTHTFHTTKSIMRKPLQHETTTDTQGTNLWCHTRYCGCHHSQFRIYLLPSCLLYAPVYLLREPSMSMISGMKLANMACDGAIYSSANHTHRW